MNAQDLKNSILQLAVQGKLVEQRPEEGSAKELLAQIKAEKDRLIKDKKIKKEKPLPEITDEEKPFDIPESWEWVRLGNVVRLINGRAYKKEELLSNGRYKVLRVGNFFTNETWYYSDLELEQEKYCNTGDLLYAWSASFGPRIWEGEKCIFHYHIWNVKFDVNSFSKEYLYWVLLWDVNTIRRSTTGTTMIHVSMENMKPRLIPIPPLTEQKRIVAKIEEILPYIEQYDKAYTKLETFNKKFPSDMKKSILQLSMQGKLVEQRPEEGTAEELYQQIVAEKSRLIKEGKIKKEKPLDKITDDEIPFEIPESWKWVRLNDLCEKIGSGSTPTGGKNVYKESGIKFLRSQNVYNDGLRYEGIVYISEEQNKASSVVKAKDILLNITGGSIGRCAIVPDDFDIANINQHVMIIRNIELELRYWIHIVIISAYIQNKIMDVQVGVSREGLSAEKLKNFLIPLPPLAEQKRIVAKLEQMLPYCDQLIK